MERVVGIEPTFPAWKAGVLPIYDTRKYIFIIKSIFNIVNIFFKKIYKRKTGLEPATSTLVRWRSTIEPLSQNKNGAGKGSRTLTPLALDPKSSASANSATSAYFFFGGGWWIRTTESDANRFTVCPLWPLGKSSVIGADDRSRTYNLLITSQLLCHWATPAKSI